MTSRTWNGSSDFFSDLLAWSPAGVPGPGDTAVINSGTVFVTGTAPQYLYISLDALSATPGLLLAGANLPAYSEVAVNSETNAAIVGVTGVATNDGNITFIGASKTGIGGIDLLDKSGGGDSHLVNNGGINIDGQSVILQNVGSNSASTFVNDGTISIRDGGNLDVTGYVDGTGTIFVAPNSTMQFAGVSSGQSVFFEPGGAGSVLTLNKPTQFDAAIYGFAAGDTVKFVSPIWDSIGTSHPTSSSFTITFSQNGTTVASLTFQGNFQQFYNNTTQIGSGLEQTTIQTTASVLPAQVSFTDTLNGVSASDQGAAYTGPGGPTFHYTWQSSDPVAISATTANAYLTGGTNGDALQAIGGNNVIDGGTGSNFLVGSPGSGTDTFFMDVRNQTTWNTIVNFHAGDTAMLFGFTGGTSTRPYTASDGAAGYTGLTIHSELNGVGTGVNASLTFAGLTQATADAHFTYTTGTSSGMNFLQIAYDH